LKARKASDFRVSGHSSKLGALNQAIAACDRCPRLVRHCQEIAVIKRRAYRESEYWGKPVPSFGDPKARLLILGLAPGAHGANRTGRMFTGDRSGEFLFRSLHRAGFASQPECRDAADGLTLSGAWITAAAHCAPPDNKPLPQELRNCRPFLEREIDLLTELRLVVVLGRIAFDTFVGLGNRRPEVRFAHGAYYGGNPGLLCSYHPSQQNTSTGRLTQGMLDEIFARAAELIRSAPDPTGSRP
jgi:uracil-DNA glycosylase family 4